MASTTTTVIAAPASDWQGDSTANPNFRALGKLSPPVMRKIEPYGAAFLAYARRKRHGRTFSEDDRIRTFAWPRTTPSCKANRLQRHSPRSRNPKTTMTERSASLKIL
jgi:hypothetical protein